MKQEVVLPCSILLMLLATSKSGFPGTFSTEDKKGILITEYASKLPPNIRDEFHKSIKQHPNRLVLRAGFERAKNAILALKKLEARCNMGISKQDYIRALGETEVEVNMFIGSNEANHFSNIKLSIVKTMQFYRNISDYLELSALETGICRQQGRDLEAYHIEKKYQNLISQSLSEASQELAIASPTLNYCKLQ